jgi:2-hydroxychromene-2-carboxylate isomerase
MKKIDWYFDFISPFAYLVSQSLHRLPDDVELQPRPILFAGLLKHWETKGPAEIPAMRRYTFRHIRWLADKHGIALTLPPMHPFNPLKLLRLCIALESSDRVVQRLFRFVWSEGKSSDSPEQWQSLADELGVDDIDTLIGSQFIKDQLSDNTRLAIQRGIFGVPTFVVDEEIFWGFDAFEFLSDYLACPELLCSAGMYAVDRMQAGVTRR